MQIIAMLTQGGAKFFIIRSRPEIRAELLPDGRDIHLALRVFVP